MFRILEATSPNLGLETAILIDVLSGFRQSLEANAKGVPQIKQQPFPLTSIQFINRVAYHSTPHYLSYRERC
jgi:hypothetical protein